MDMQPSKRVGALDTKICGIQCKTEQGSDEPSRYELETHALTVRYRTGGASRRSFVPAEIPPRVQRVLPTGDRIIWSRDTNTLTRLELNPEP
jgi:hypothetical protein